MPRDHHDQPDVGALLHSAFTRISDAEIADAGRRVHLSAFHVTLDVPLAAPRGGVIGSLQSLVPGFLQASGPQVKDSDIENNPGLTQFLNRLAAHGLTGTVKPATSYSGFRVTFDTVEARKLIIV